MNNINLNKIYLPSLERKLFCLICGNIYSIEAKIENWEDKIHFCPYCNKETKNIVIGVIE